MTITGNKYETGGMAFVISLPQNEIVSFFLFQQTLTLGKIA